MKPPFTRTWICGVVLMLFGLLWAGCSGSPPSALPEQTTSEDSAAELLKKMQAAYRNARSYTDNADYVQHSVLRSEGVEREILLHQMTLAFERPNKLRLQFSQGIANSPGRHKYDIASNGVRVRSHASELPLQVHEAVAPLALTPGNIIPEPEIRAAVLEVSLENLFPQLWMLLSAGDEEAIFRQDSEPKLLEKMKLGNASCYRVNMQSPAGARVLWIDEETFALRRMELPVAGQKSTIDPDDIYSKLAIRIDFQNATLDAEIDPQAFEMEIPEEARRVRRLVAPPPKSPPAELGQSVEELVFRTLDGKEVTSAQLANKIVVLDFWYTGCPPCKMQTPVLEKVYQRFKDSDDVLFYAVSTDHPRITDEVVDRTLSSWGSTMPVLRDLADSGYDKLNVRVTPTVVLLGPDGRLQKFQTGAHMDPEPLTAAIQQLADGEDLAALAWAEHEQRVDEYQQELDAATIKDSVLEVQIARPEVPPRQLPEKFTLTEVWTSSLEELQAPGDILVLANSLNNAARALVLDSGKAIVELRSNGETIGRHALPEHEEQTNGFLRTTVDGDGRRWYLASGFGWQQAFLLNDRWETSLSFPDQPHSGIGDILLADLADTGAPLMYVGYWGGLGVQGGTLDGRRLWANRRLDHVLQVVAGPELPDGKRTAWCTSTRGTITQLSSEGKFLDEMSIQGHSLMAVSSTESLGESSTRHCGLAVREVGNYTVVGFETDGAVLWEYDLPQGEYVYQIPRIQTVQLPDDGRAWLIAAADGSLHWLSLQGELIDRFNYGELLTGVAMSDEPNTPMLWVATNEKLTVWQIEPAAEP